MRAAHCHPSCRPEIGGRATRGGRADARTDLSPSAALQACDGCGPPGRSDPNARAERGLFGSRQREHEIATVVGRWRPLAPRWPRMPCPACQAQYCRLATRTNGGEGTADARAITCGRIGVWALDLFGRVACAQRISTPRGATP